MNLETLRLFRDFIHAVSKGRIAPYDWSFSEQEISEKLQMALQREIDALEAEDTPT